MTNQELEARVENAAGPIIKVDILHGDDVESVWAKIESEDAAALYNNSVTGQISVLLMNQAMIMGPTWGRKILVTLTHNRPCIKVEDLISQCIEQEKT
jgi:hypothetical protein